MPDTRLPARLRTDRSDRRTRSCPPHRAWVRKHHCCVPGCLGRPIECAHVRGGADGGTGLKPSDRWCISLCSFHHAEQHRIGEARFEIRYDLALADLDRLFARRSPHARTLTTND